MRLLHCAAGLVFASVFAFGQTSTISTFAGEQSLGPGFGGNASIATSAQLNDPDGVAIDSAGNVYISDFNNAMVRIVTPDGNINAFAGNGTIGHGGDGTLAINATLAGPLGLAVDVSGNVYIADGPSNTVRKVLPNGIISTVAGSGTGGFSGDGGAATSASLNYPSAVAVDSSGNIYIADAGNHRIREVSSGTIRTIAGSSTFGFGGDGFPAINAQLYLPKGVAVDASGNVYIADTQNQRIRKITGGTITTIAGTGTAGYSGDKGAAVNAQVNTPTAITVDPSGNVYIADTGNNVIRKITGNIISTVAGNGTPGYTGDGGIATNAELNAPAGVAVDPTGGYAYIADSNNNVIRLIATPYATTYIPHFAAGGSYLTAFYVINKGTQIGSFTLSFNDDTGTPLPVPISGQSSPATSFTGTVPAGGTGYYEIGNLSTTPGIDGSIVVTSNSFLVVQAMIRHIGASGAYYEAADATTSGNLEIKTAFDATTFQPTGAQIYTGFAIVNTDSVNTATVTCTAADNSGNAIANALQPIMLPPLGHSAGYNFPALFGLRGTLDCASTTKIGVLTLRFIGNETFSTLPIIPVK